MKYQVGDHVLSVIFSNGDLYHCVITGVGSEDMGMYTFERYIDGVWDRGRGLRTNDAMIQQLIPEHPGLSESDIKEQYPELFI